jgi:hypothetical protein
MSRIKLIFGLLAIAMLSAFAPASASAAVCSKEANKKFVLCLNTVLTEGSKSMRIANDTIHNYVLKSSGITVGCENVKSTGGEVTSASGSTEFRSLILEFSTCKVTTPSHCKVAEPIKTESLRGIIVTKEHFEFLGPVDVFATLKFESNGGTCLVAGSLKVTGVAGGQACTSSDIETNQESHLFQCAASGSHLKLGEESATFEGNFTDSLAEGGSWAVIEGK